jgi:hypothetical protein
VMVVEEMAVEEMVGGPAFAYGWVPQLGHAACSAKVASRPLGRRCSSRSPL